MKKLIFILLVCVCTNLQAQMNRTFTSIEVALKKPLEVYKLQLTIKNQVTTPKEISQFVNLTNLVIYDSTNTLNSLSPEIWQLKNLKDLSLSRCGNLTFLPKEIGQLKKLEILSLDDCNSLISLPKEIGQLKKLKSLYLYSDAIMTIPDEIKNLKNLKGLGCSEDLLISSKQIQNLKNLERLSLTQSKNSTSPPKEIGNFTNLNGLTIIKYYNLVSLPTEIGNLKKLKEIDLFICQKISDEEKTKIKKLLPNCVIKE